MFLTVVATITCVCVVVFPAVAELRRIQADRDNPLRLLEIPTRRSQVQDRQRSR